MDERQREEGGGIRGGERGSEGKKGRTGKGKGKNKGRREEAG